MTSSAPRTAFYTGSFDPVTNGHADVIAGAARLCDRLVLAIGVHPGKTPLLPAEQRAALLREIATPLLAASGVELSKALCEHFSQSRAELFEIVSVTGWAPHDSQQKPLRPGSAKMRLADALGTQEQSTGDKAG